MDSVVTLAAIEYGKGNVDVSTMHIDGVKRMVQMRGGINKVKVASPLTARMVSCVTSSSLDNAQLDPEIRDTACRLRLLFDSRQFSLTSTDIHDLTCFVVHKLLLWHPSALIDGYLHEPMLSQSLQHALVLYMLMVQGPTYFSHAGLQYTTVLKLRSYLEHTWCSLLPSHDALALWLLSVGMVAADGMPSCGWFMTQAHIAAKALEVQGWSDLVARLQDVIWLDSPTITPLFQRKWDEIWVITTT
ncbi:hypothetical protein N0V94_007769 [Neodidymelliopsis sp. IMI 364377]|nr:hypothetical protein N0V94_007769 [Neodidymelliopsis sp. IMI 364377]